ncbi:biliverdin-producing heme oxygenase [Methylobacterium iners]|uniref:Heme oxygenase n=1 Tax=Methylobacterium iners TaxID=418707 RepID=A0ABQ4S1M9_9HYPH|nr:biliverdin-producing heme oxygenase [Methylobacterium iners]GJD96394.1 hypothetical protein OCOJLMKI_3615 [Methylobacterium iners]
MANAAGVGAVALIDQLRNRTRDLHEGLELDLDWERRMATLKGYTRLLARWWGFHAVFEPLLETKPPFVGLDGRGKLHLIERDLHHLGFSPDAIAALPRIEALTFLSDRASMVGAMYVVEGSTLGGQVISRHVRHLHGPEISDGACAYFLGYGKAATAPMWRAFQDRLLGIESSSHDAVVTGARQTFQTLRDWLPR